MRLRPRFSLRTLLIATILIGIAWPATVNWLRQPARVKAMAAAKRSSAIIVYDCQVVPDEGSPSGHSNPWLRMSPIWKSSDEVPPADIATRLSGDPFFWSHVVYVEFPHCQCGGGCPPVDDDSLLALAGFPRFKRLRTEWYQGGYITDRGIRVVESLPDLEQLDLPFSNIGDEGLKSIARCSKLKFLAVYAPALTAAGARELARLPELEMLILESEALSTRCLTDLASAPSLKRLELYGNRLYDADIRAFHERRPDCVLVTGTPRAR